MDKDKVRRMALRPFRSAAGKGDRPRPVDMDKYRENYDKIFRKDVDHDETETTERTDADDD